MKKNKINLKKVHKILFIMMGGIGNLILCLPALNTLRKGIPWAKITLFLAEPDIQEAIVSEKVFDDVILFDRREKHKLSDVYRIIDQVHKKNFDLAIVASHTNPLKASFFTFICGIPSRLGQNINGRGLFYTLKIPSVKNQHETIGSLALVESLGIKPAEQYPQLHPQAMSQERAFHFLHERGWSEQDLLIGIHAGSGFNQKYKRWPANRFARVADFLITNNNAKILLTGGKGEVDMVSELAQRMEGYPINAAGKVPLPQTIALIQRCQLFISNDSGLAHIAAALGIPLIVLFGSTDEKRIRPRGWHVHIIKRTHKDLYKRSKHINPIMAITENDVLTKAQKIIKQVYS